MAPSTSSSKPKGLSRNATPAEIQAHQLNKLLANPEKDVYIPQRPKEGVTKTLRPPREMMKNVQGSSAGAGSGEFHVYKQSRRREYERLKLMDEEEAFVGQIHLTWHDERGVSLGSQLQDILKQKQEAEERQRLAEQEAEERTSKNRLKRQRKKEARTKHKGTDKESENAVSGPASAGSAPGVGTSNEGGDAKKRKLAGGATFKFKSAEEREDEEADESRSAESGLASAVTGEEAVLRNTREEDEIARPAQEAGISIQDDD
ncbi:PRKRIP1 family protein [Sporobolomyces koalae]|uniref:PRKRIP1 family protein n=1 Tax=Sporobolomyces koalae TaxID=500713 RepID=UPI003181A3C5